jgi:hypothetical protein
MSKATKKLLITASASVFLMAATAAPTFAAPSNPGYYVGNQKYLLSDIAANPSLLVQLNNNLNTKGLSSFIADLPEGRLNYAQFMAANPGKLNLSAFKTFAAAHPAIIPADAVIVRPDGREERDPDSPLPGISVQNGLITISFSSAPSVTPTIKDFVVTQSVYGGSNPQVIVPSGLQLNADSTVVSLSVPIIAATDIAQNIVYTVAYKLSSTVSAGFTLAANPTTGEPVGQAAISTVSAVNGTIKVNFNKPVSVTEAIYGMKISRSIDGGQPTTEVLTVDQTSGNTVTFKVDKVQSAASDQNVVYSLSYLNGTAINTVKFTVAKIPATIVSASAVNGTITVNFDKAVSVVEATYDMKISRSINGGAGTTEEPSLVQASGNTVTFKVVEVQSAAADQNVVYSLSYLNQNTYKTVSFTVPTTIASVSAVNGSVTVKFTPEQTVSEATYQNLVFKQTIITHSAPDATSTNSVTPTASVLDSVNNTVTFTFPTVQKLYDEQSVTYSVYNSGNVAVSQSSLKFDTGVLKRPEVQNNFVIYNNKSSQINGIGEPGFKVNMEITDTDISGKHKVEINNLMVDINGNFGTIFDQNTISALKDGPVNITVTQIDQSGRIADKKSNEASGTKKANTP